VAFSRCLAGQDDRDTVLAEVVAAALGQIDGAEHAAVEVIGIGDGVASVSSDDMARELARCQHTAGEGPLRSVVTEHCGVVQVDDLRADTRWPRFAAAAAALDVRSVLAVHLYATAGGRVDSIGTLAAYAAAPAAFTDDSVRAGLLLAGPAAIAAAAAERAAQLRTGLVSRDTIGQAKGILMERFRITAERAFQMLVTASQHGNGKLRDVADLLVATGELPLPGRVDPSVGHRATRTTVCTAAREANSSS
jgi:hypothetical protein